MHPSILQEVHDSIRAIETLKSPESLRFMEAFAQLLAQTFTQGGKLILAGNGGSLCDAAHFAEELTGFFRKKRPPLPAIVLSEPGHLTCTGNDAGFDAVFSRGVEAFGKPGDLFCALTTSGNSENLVQAHEAARKLGLKTILFLGKGGGKLKGKGDLELIIDGFKTSDRIQEAHMAAIHIILQRMETLLFP
jgi:D-sedoheptulose 7-phosphate isomerase